MEDKRLRYSDLVNLIEKISLDPNYKDHQQELVKILEVIVNYVDISHQVKKGVEHVEQRRKILGAPPVENSLRSVEDVLKNG